MIKKENVEQKKTQQRESELCVGVFPSLGQIQA